VTSYVAWYGKKRTRLAECEHEFLIALDGGVVGAPLDKAVEAIRAAQIRALKEKRAKFAPSESSASTLNAIAQDLQWWMDAPQSAIIEGYRDAKRRRTMSSAVRRATK
jgi:hypothetical protein